jgi:type III restriction enzyme
VLETKGDQLAGNLDTSYKEAVLSVLSGNFDWNQTARVGEMQLVKEDGLTVHCSLVLMSDIPTQLPPLLQVP